MHLFVLDCKILGAGILSSIVLSTMVLNGLFSGYLGTQSGIPAVLGKPLKSHLSWQFLP